MGSFNDDNDYRNIVANNPNIANKELVDTMLELDMSTGGRIHNSIKNGTYSQEAMDSVVNEIADMTMQKYLDTDNDGTPNYLDADDDGDYVPDYLDPDTDQLEGMDSDNDSIPDALDSDDDNDGIPDVTDSSPRRRYDDDEEFEFYGRYGSMADPTRERFVEQGQVIRGKRQDGKLATQQGVEGYIGQDEINQERVKRGLTPKGKKANQDAVKGFLTKEPLDDIAGIHDRDEALERFGGSVHPRKKMNRAALPPSVLTPVTPSFGGGKRSKPPGFMPRMPGQRRRR